jgi:hypothetical protein
LFGGVVVNEVGDKRSGNGGCASEDFIELKNLTPNNLDLNGFVLADDTFSPTTLGSTAAASLRIVSLQQVAFFCFVRLTQTQPLMPAFPLISVARIP